MESLDEILRLQGSLAALENGVRFCAWNIVPMPLRPCHFPSAASLCLFCALHARFVICFQFIHMNVRPPASPSTLSEDPDGTHFTSLYQELHASSPPRRRQQSNATSQRRSGNTVNRGPSKSPKLPSIHRKSQTRSPHAGLSHWGPGSHKSTTWSSLCRSIVTGN